MDAVGSREPHRVPGRDQRADRAVVARIDGRRDRGATGRAVGLPQLQVRVASSGSPTSWPAGKYHRSPSLTTSTTAVQPLDASPRTVVPAAVPSLMARAPSRDRNSLSPDTVSGSVAVRRDRGLHGSGGADGPAGAEQPRSVRRGRHVPGDARRTPRVTRWSESQSATPKVPVRVPSLTDRWAAWRPPRSGRPRRRRPVAVAMMVLGRAPDNWRVPARVPSVDHSPHDGPSAPYRSRSSNTTGWACADADGPVPPTRTVPGEVPSLFQTLRPCTPSEAMKNTLW